MISKIFTINSSDVVKGIALAVITAVIGAIQQALTTYGFDFASYDWNTIGQIAVTAGIGYIVKNYLSDENGKVFGRIG